MAKKLMTNGERFGFVRFEAVTNVRAFAIRLNQIWIGTYKLRVFIANHNVRELANHNGREFKGAGKLQKRKEEERIEEGQIGTTKSLKQSSYAEVVRNGRKKDAEDGESKQQTLGRWEPDEVCMKFLQTCAVGSITTPDNIKAVQSFCKKEIRECGGVKQVGRSSVLIRQGGFKGGHEGEEGTGVEEKDSASGIGNLDLAEKGTEPEGQSITKEESPEPPNDDRKDEGSGKSAEKGAEPFPRRG
ncbi:hypothetical protein L6452_44359 [Arctium lappa]|uniref:Uncharacterized protein n=1 Tax=Arctium lappa TaxID=4217 RepID=A0ACB8XF15_ARCLA|nr:hypothetical protein L6452_44359 [Arctium lappa]